MNTSKVRRWVVKIGSALLTDPESGLARQMIRDLVAEVAVLQTEGIEVVLVSSGSIAEGMQRLSWEERPHALHELQAAAAVGQMGLIEAYESAFRQYDIHTAQVLLTDADVADRSEPVHRKHF